MITGLNSLEGECHGTEAVEHLLLPLGGTNGERADAGSFSRSSPRPGPAMEASKTVFRVTLLPLVSGPPVLCILDDSPR